MLTGTQVREFLDRHAMIGRSGCQLPNDDEKRWEVLTLYRGKQECQRPRASHEIRIGGDHGT